MSLNFDSLTKSIDVLKRSISSFDNYSKDLNNDLIDTLKSGIIQHFKVAYEQSWKMIQRWLKENYSPENADNPRTRKELFRIAAKVNLIRDPLPWFSYGDARNMTSHTYDQLKADSVYKTAREFVEDAEYLLRQLKKAND